MGRPREFDEEEVLSNVYETFWKFGYSATSIALLEETTRIGRISLYKAYGNKRQLFGRVLETYHDQQLRSIEELVSSGERFNTCARELLTHAVEVLTSKELCRGCFSANTTAELAFSDDDAWSAVSAYRVSFIAKLQTLAGVESSLPISPKAAATFIYTVYSGLGMLAKSGASRADLEEVIETSLRAIAVE